MSENHNNDQREKGFDVKSLITIENVAIVRSYLLGYKKNGKPRAIYDVFKDQVGTVGNKKKKKKKKKAEKFSLYIDPRVGKKKGKKGKKGKKNHWEF